MCSLCQLTLHLSSQRPANTLHRLHQVVTNSEPLSRSLFVGCAQTMRSCCCTPNAPPTCGRVLSSGNHKALQHRGKKQSARPVVVLLFMPNMRVYTGCLLPRHQ